MLTQIIFKADKNLKDAALKKAHQEGITLRALLSICMKAYVSDKLKLDIEPTLDPETIEVTPDLQAKINKIAKLIDEKNI